MQSFKNIFYYVIHSLYYSYIIFIILNTLDISRIVSGGEAMKLSKNVMHEIVSAFPGIDEAMSYAEVMK